VSAAPSLWPRSVPCAWPAWLPRSKPSSGIALLWGLPSSSLYPRVHLAAAPSAAETLSAWRQLQSPGVPGVWGRWQGQPLCCKRQGLGWSCCV
jgi:hypothetical protein